MVNDILHKPRCTVSMKYIITMIEHWHSLIIVAKYLGVTLQLDVRWDKHINENIASTSTSHTLGLILLHRSIKTPQHI